MAHTVSAALVFLISFTFLLIGAFYVIAPSKIMGSFGLIPPVSDSVTLAWLRLKGIRDVTSGLVVITLQFTAPERNVGILLLVLAIIPFGDMCNVLASGGRKLIAYSVHGLTALTVIATGVWLLQLSR